jgi:signal peptidase I
MDEKNTQTKYEEGRDSTAEYLEAEQTDSGASLGSFVTDLVKVVIVAIIAMLLFRYFVAEPFIVSGTSMVPTYQNHQYLVINKMTYRFHKPERGDVIVFRYPQNTKEFFIKRVIGLPGEKVKVDSGHVVVYNNDHPEGKVLDEPYLASQDITFGDSKITTLGSDEYFVLGDNRLQSSDSRLWGVLPSDDIVGKVLVRVFPPQDFKFITDPTYQF